MKQKYGRRSKDDPKWQEVKDIVYKRDKCSCRLAKCLSMKEYFSLKKGFQQNVDPAHIFSASAEPSQIYNPKNIVCLTRFVHHRMDSYQSPLDGSDVDLNTHYYWWWRIYKSSIEDYDAERDYKQMLREEIFE